MPNLEKVCETPEEETKRTKFDDIKKQEDFRKIHKEPYTDERIKEIREFDEEINKAGGKEQWIAKKTEELLNLRGIKDKGERISVGVYYSRRFEFAFERENEPLLARGIYEQIKAGLLRQKEKLGE